MQSGTEKDGVGEARRELHQGRDRRRLHVEQVLLRVLAKRTVTAGMKQSRNGGSGEDTESCRNREAIDDYCA